MGPWELTACHHFNIDSTAAKRMSLPYGHRSRSHSESKPLPASEVVAETQEKKDGVAPSSSLSSAPSKSTDKVSSLDSDVNNSKCESNANSSSTSNDKKKADEQPDQELLKTLSSFLRGDGNAADDPYKVNKPSRTSKDKNTSSAPSEPSPSAGPVRNMPPHADMNFLPSYFFFFCGHSPFLLFFYPRRQMQMH